MSYWQLINRLSYKFIYVDMSPTLVNGSFSTEIWSFWSVPCHLGDPEQQRGGDLATSPAWSRGWGDQWQSGDLLRERPIGGSKRESKGSEKSTRREWVVHWVTGKVTRLCGRYIHIIIIIIIITIIYIYMVVSWVMTGYPQSSSILMRFSIINKPFWGTPIYGPPHMYL